MILMVTVGDLPVESPYFNTVAKHSYNVGKTLIINYRERKIMKRVIKQWIEEYKIDGFRWDLTKFTKTVRLQMRVALILTRNRCIEKYGLFLELGPIHYIILSIGR
jgi:hypothetical protein